MAFLVRNILIGPVWALLKVRRPMLQRSMSGVRDKINPIPPTRGKHRIRLSFIIPKESWRRMFAEAAAPRSSSTRAALARDAIWTEPRNGRDETLVRCDIQSGRLRND